MFIIYKQYINIQYQVYKNIHNIHFQLFLVGMMKKYKNGKCQKDTQVREQKILCFSPCVFDREDEKVEGYKINYYYVLIIKSKRLKRYGNFVILFLIIIFSQFFFSSEFGSKKMVGFGGKLQAPNFLSFQFSLHPNNKKITFFSLYLPLFSIIFFSHQPKHIRNIHLDICLLFNIFFYFWKIHL